jgi:hypothetical protein
MPVKTIKVGDKTLTVQNADPYQYNYGDGKVVLQIGILEIDHDYDTIAVALKNPATDIDYFEDGVKKCTHIGFTRDFRCSYSGGLFSVEVTRVTQAELDIEALQAAREQSDQAIAELSILVAGGIS